MIAKKVQSQIMMWRYTLEYLSHADDAQILKFIHRIMWYPIVLGFSYGLFAGVLICGLVILR